MQVVLCVTARSLSLSKGRDRVVMRVVPFDKLRDRWERCGISP